MLESKLDPDNRARLIEWAQDNFNENKMLFGNPLQLDIEALKNYEPPQPVLGAGGDPGDEDEEGGRKPGLPSPFARGDSNATTAWPFLERRAR